MDSKDTKNNKVIEIDKKRVTTFKNDVTVLDSEKKISFKKTCNRDVILSNLKSSISCSNFNIRN